MMVRIVNTIGEDTEFKNVTKVYDLRNKAVDTFYFIEKGVECVYFKRNVISVTMKGES